MGAGWTSLGALGPKEVESGKKTYTSRCIGLLVRNLVIPAARAFLGSVMTGHRDELDGRAKRDGAKAWAARGLSSLLGSRLALYGL